MKRIAKANTKRTYDEAVVDGEVDGPPADDGDDGVHAEVEHQQEEGHGLHVVPHFSLNVLT